MSAALRIRDWQTRHQLCLHLLKVRRFIGCRIGANGFRHGDTGYRIVSPRSCERDHTGEVRCGRIPRGKRRQRPALLEGLQN